MKTWKERMMKALRMALCILPIALFGGFFTGIYTYEHYNVETREMILQQLGSYEALLAVATIQSTMYAIFACVIGYLLADSLGLVRPFGFQKSILKKTVPMITLFGILFACDYFVFGRLIPEVAADYERGVSPAYFLCSLTYGGVIEEVLIRWFFMSLIAWIIWKIFAGKYGKKEIPAWVFITANILAAVVFAAGHLPTSISIYGGLTPVIVFRCFLLNGCFALLFGRYYRKYGIQYAMLGHFGIHLVSKTILLLVL
ncbi:MAG: type II CAAX prenyl endopeptidase Rce1 family protein [Lachnospiraceae bacterium]